MADDPPRPSFSDAHVMDRLRKAAKRGLTHVRKAEAELIDYDYDLAAAKELIAECSDDELYRHELSDNYPEYNDYMVILKVELEDERRPFYVKVALALPDLDSGELVSFHPWGQYR